MVRRFPVAPVIAVCLLLSYFSSYSQKPSPGFAGKTQSTSSGSGPVSVPASNASDVAIVGNHAYVVTGNNEFYIIDISTPYLPTIISKLTQFNVSLLNGLSSIFISGNFAFITCRQNNALVIIDITNLAAPVYAGSILDSPTGAELSAPEDVEVVGNLAYVARQGGLEIVDVTSKTAPLHKSKLEFGLGYPSNGITLSGNYAYINNAFTFSIIDISNPSSPTVVSTLMDNGTNVRINEPSPPVLRGNYLYMTSRSSSSLEVFDVSNKANPLPVAFVGNDGMSGAIFSNPTAVTLSGDYAYVTNGDASTLEIIDISVPTAPVHETNISSAPPAFTFLSNSVSVTVSGNYAFVGSQLGLEVFYIFTPTPPVAKPAQSGSPGTFVASWSAVHGTTSYLLDVSEDDFNTFLPGYNSLSITPQQTSKTITGLSATKTYQYRVRSNNVNGPSIYSATISTPPSPPVPVAIAATATGQTTFTANWQPIDGISAYLLNVSTDETFATGTVLSNEGVSGTTRIVTDLTPGTVYYYLVSSANALGISVPSNMISQITLPPTPTTVALTPDAISQTSFTAKWNAAKSATGYFVDVLNEAGVTLSNYNNVSVASGTTFVVNGVDPGTKYSFVVRAKNSAGISESSTKQIVLTIPPTPVAVAAEVSGTVSFKANWQTSKSATKYRISAFTENGSALPGYTGFDAGNTLSTIITVNAPVTGGIYSYKVSASNESGDSPFSEAVFVNTPATQFPNILLPTGGLVESYIIVSLPDGTTASTALAAESFAKTWRMMQYDNATDVNKDITNISNMQPGKGYWVNSNLDEAPSIVVTGTTTASAKKITLQPGWNQIGNPLNFDISWADVLVENSSSGIGNLFTFNVPTVNGRFSEHDRLKAYGGGFVNNTKTSVVELAIPADMPKASGRVGKNGIITSKDIFTAEWFLPITVDVNGGVNNLSGIGMHPDASNTIDQFDAIALPRLFNFPQISSNHPEFFQPKFMRDVVTTSASHTWKLDINSDNGGEIKLSWDNTQWTGAFLFLIDEEAGVLLDMSAVSDYSCNTNSVRTLKFAYSLNGRFASDVSAFGSPYPNPSRDRIRFPFIAGDGENISVKVSDVTGRTVFDVSSNSLISGYNEIVWDMTGDATVASGIYLFQVRTSGGKYKAGRIVVR